MKATFVFGRGRALLAVLVVVATARAQSPGVALVRHAPALNGGTIDGSVQQMLAENVTLNGGLSVTGDLLVPGTPAVRLNGKPTYAGTLDGSGAATPTNFEVTLNGAAALRHVVRRTDATMLPGVAAPPGPAGDRAVTLTLPNQSPGDFATLRDLTLSGAAPDIAVPSGAYGDFTANGAGGFTLGIAGATQPALYYFQHVTLNGAAKLQVVGPVVVTIANAITFNGAVGSAANPRWLTLNVASGGVVLNGNAICHARVNAPTGSVVLNGNCALYGALMCDRLTLNGHPTLQVLSLSVVVPNQPPTVTLTAPLSGALFNVPASIALAATANDPDGSVAKVEFYQSATKLGESAHSPFAFTWAGMLPGSYSLTARAYDNQNAIAISAPATIRVQAALPYVTDFEAAEGYALGAINGQGAWSASGAATVIEAEHHHGARALSLEAGTLAAEVSQAFPAYTGQAVVFFDLAAKLVAGSTSVASSVISCESARLGVVKNGVQAELNAFDGDGFGGGAWRPLGILVGVNASGQTTNWLRLTVRLDYAAHRWDVYLDGKLVAYDLGFGDATRATLERIVVQGTATSATVVDEVYVGFENPLFTDADQDGMDDAWERQFGLNPSINDRYGDADGDGLINLREFLLGTRPNARDSDGDGLPDGWEVFYHFDPRVNDGDADADGDGVTNLQEYLLGREPTKGAMPDTTNAVALRLYVPNR